MNLTDFRRRWMMSKINPPLFYLPKRQSEPDALVYRWVTIAIYAKVFDLDSHTQIDAEDTCQATFTAYRYYTVSRISACEFVLLKHPRGVSRTDHSRDEIIYHHTPLQHRYAVDGAGSATYSNFPSADGYHARLLLETGLYCIKVIRVTGGYHRYGGASAVLTSGERVDNEYHWFTVNEDTPDGWNAFWVKVFLPLSIYHYKFEEGAYPDDLKFENQYHKGNGTWANNANYVDFCRYQKWEEWEESPADSGNYVSYLSDPKYQSVPMLTRLDGKNGTNPNNEDYGNYPGSVIAGKLPPSGQHCSFETGSVPCGIQKFWIDNVLVYDGPWIGPSLTSSETFSSTAAYEGFFYSTSGDMGSDYYSHSFAIGKLMLAAGNPTNGFAINLSCNNQISINHDADIDIDVIGTTTMCSGSIEFLPKETYYLRIDHDGTATQPIGWGRAEYISEYSSKTGESTDRATSYSRTIANNSSDSENTEISDRVYKITGHNTDPLMNNKDLIPQGRTTPFIPSYTFDIAETVYKKNDSSMYAEPVDSWWYTVTSYNWASGVTTYTDYITGALHWADIYNLMYQILIHTEDRYLYNVGTTSSPTENDVKIDYGSDYYLIKNREKYDSQVISTNAKSIWSDIHPMGLMYEVESECVLETARRADSTTWGLEATGIKREHDISSEWKQITDFSAYLDSDGHGVLSTIVSDLLSTVSGESGKEAYEQLLAAGGLSDGQIYLTYPYVSPAVYEGISDVNYTRTTLKQSIVLSRLKYFIGLDNTLTQDFQNALNHVPDWGYDWYILRGAYSYMANLGCGVVRYIQEDGTSTETISSIGGVDYAKQVGKIHDRNNAEIYAAGSVPSFTDDFSQWQQRCREFKVTNKWKHTEGVSGNIWKDTVGGKELLIDTITAEGISIQNLVAYGGDFAGGQEIENNLPEEYTIYVIFKSLTSTTAWRTVVGTSGAVPQHDLMIHGGYVACGGGTSDNGTSSISATNGYHIGVIRLQKLRTFYSATAPYMGYANVDGKWTRTSSSRSTTVETPWYISSDMSYKLIQIHEGYHSDCDIWENIFRLKKEYFERWPWETMPTS